MRKRRDQSDATKKFMTIFMAVLMVGSLFGVVFFGFTSSGFAPEDYNEYEFEYRVDHWETVIDDKVALFTYFPTDVDYIEVPADVSQRIRNTIQFDITSDINDTLAEQIALAQFQMGLTLANFNLFMRTGFTEENEFNQEVINCDQATEFVPVIYFREANESKVYLENNCVIADIASEVEVERVKDRLVYDILGIIQ